PTLLHTTHEFFSFPADDGIRDATVTGVQTCALPISGAIVNDPNTSVTFNGTSQRINVPPLPSVQNFSIEGWTYLTKSSVNNNTRSEERRVGKECRCREWAAREREQRHRGTEERQREG